MRNVTIRQLAVHRVEGRYYTLAGDVVVTRSLYRAARNGKVVDAISLRTGALEGGWLPDTAAAVAHLLQQGPSRHPPSACVVDGCTSTTLMPVSTHSSTRRILATYLTRRTRTPYLAGPEYVAFTLMRHSSARGGWPRTGRPARCAGASPVTVVWRRGRVGLFADRTRRGRPLSLHWQWAYGPAVRLVVGRPYEPPVSNTAPRRCRIRVK